MAPVELKVRLVVFGRMVERDDAASSPVDEEILYGPTGYLGEMNGQTPNAIRDPLPGGANYNTYAGSFIHKDWLGSGRLETSRVNRVVNDGAAYAPFGEVYATRKNLPPG